MENTATGSHAGAEQGEVGSGGGSCIAGHQWQFSRRYRQPQRPSSLRPFSAEYEHHSDDTSVAAVLLAARIGIAPPWIGAAAVASALCDTSRGAALPHLAPRSVVALSPATASSVDAPVRASNAPAAGSSPPVDPGTLAAIKEEQVVELFDELCSRDPPCCIDVRQVRSLVRHCGIDVSEDDVRDVMLAETAGSSSSSSEAQASKAGGRGNSRGPVLVELEQFRRVLAHWPALDLTDLDIESLWTQCRETVEGPVVSHLPRTLWQMAMPKMLLSFLAGGIAGAGAKSAIAPFDRMKILFQSSNMHYSTANAVKLVRDIIKNEGPVALFKGNLATVFRILPYSGVQLMSYDQFKMLILRRRKGDGKLRSPIEQDRLSPVEKIAAGACAGATSVMVTYPLDLIRARLAVQRSNSEYNGIVKAFRMSIQQDGFMALYRGLTPSLLGILPYAGFAFATFETLKQLSRDRTGHAPTGMERLVYGGVAGLVGQCFVYPLDVVRRRLQTAGFVDGTQNAPRGLIPMLRYVHRTEGFRGLFKGMSLNFIKGPIAVGISFTVFDLLKHQWGVEKIAAE